MTSYIAAQKSLTVSMLHHVIKKGLHYHEALSLNHPKTALATLDLELFCNRKYQTAFHDLGIAINIIINP